MSAGPILGYFLAHFSWFFVKTARNRKRLLKNVHRRQKLTTDFFKLSELTILVVTQFRQKNMPTVVSGGSFFKGLDNKIIGFLQI